METSLDPPELSLSDTQKEAIRTKLLGEPFSQAYEFLDAFLSELELYGLEPPRLSKMHRRDRQNLIDTIDWEAIRSEGKDIFTILNHLKATVGAWGVPYVGSTARLLKEAIYEMNSNRGTLQYANFVPIVQSSGTGKSRAVDELAREVFTIPFCFRLENEKGDIPGVADLLCSGTTVEDARERHGTFFAVLFDAVHDVIINWENHHSQQALADKFRDWLIDNRDQLYRNVCNTAQSQIANGIAIRLENEGRAEEKRKEEEFKAAQRNTPSRQTSPFQKIPTGDKAGLVGGSVPMFIQRSRESIEWEAALKLVDLIQKKSGVPDSGILEERKEAIGRCPRPVWLNVYFDESHLLTVKRFEPGTENNRTAYQVLCSVINRLRAMEVFFIFLSTHSSISVYSPSNILHRSARVREGATPGVQAPICEMSFDQYKGGKYLLEERMHTMEESATLQFPNIDRSRLGPLVRFWTRFEFGDPEVRSTMVWFAQGKLTGKSNDRPNETGWLAILSVRLGLLFDRSRPQAQDKEEKLVEGYMRYIHSVPGHRDFVYTSTPSEPILAEAAARIMHINKDSGDPMRVLLEWCNNGLILKGERGELLARLFFTMAHDLAITREHTSSEPPMFTRPILLVDFLTALLGEKSKDKIMKALPDNIPGGKTLADSVLGKATLNFTHWAKARDKSVVTDEAAWIALGRCLAWQCQDGQPDIDVITPLMLPCEDDKIGRYTVSAIFWQIKNRGAPTKAEIDAEKLGFFSPFSPENYLQEPSGLEDLSAMKEFADQRPYLTIVLNLGAPIRKPKPKKEKEFSTIRVSDSKRISACDLSQKPHHPRYAVSVLGCSEHTFPEILSGGKQHEFVDLLPSVNYRTEHQRQTANFQDALVRAKADWGEDGTIGSYGECERLGSTRLTSNSLRGPRSMGNMNEMEVDESDDDTEEDTESLDDMETEG
ncbi:hypothetical protein RhiJN_25733 [Ceratobasidium sp. AG-Ba]|nr:hypothetical protein RhiJN_25733 [Ceratobasidium sp. AG-Ba]